MLALRRRRYEWQSVTRVRLHSPTRESSWIGHKPPIVARVRHHFFVKSLFAHPLWMHMINAAKWSHNR